MNLEDLKKEIPFRWRVQSFSERKAEAICIPYIDARDAQNLLDDVCGPEGWQSDFKGAGSLLMGGIGIKVEDEWLWKWDTGTETRIEKEKGHASDAFKRAGVHWGIGRFLYGIAPVKVRANKIKAKGESSPWVCDLEGKYIFDITDYINKIWNKNNAEGEEVTDLAKRMRAKHISSDDFTEKLAQYRMAFENAGRDGEFKKHLQDNFSTDNEAEIVKEFLNSAKPIIEAINEIYKKGKK
jgi:hypothetical protein